MPDNDTTPLSEDSLPSEDSVPSDDSVPSEASPTSEDSAPEDAVSEEAAEDDTTVDLLDPDVEDSFAAPPPPELEPLTPEQIRSGAEALLYLATEPLSIDVMAELIGAQPEEVEPAVRDLQERYAEHGHGLALREVGVGWRMSTAPIARDVVERFVLAGRSGRLTQAALETLAVVAYKQPIQRADVSDIRGVNADGAIRSLVARGLVQEVGRAETPGQPILYGTTPLLLEKLGLTSLDELPDLASHLPEAAPDEPRMDDLSRARRLIAEGKDLPSTGRSSWDPDAPAPMPPPEPRRRAGADEAMDELSDKLEAAAKAAMKRLQQAVTASEAPDEGDAADGDAPDQTANGQTTPDPTPEAPDAAQQEPTDG